jgi:hypothetical protein
MKTIESFNIQIWLGLKEGYSDKVYTIDDVYSECQMLCNCRKACFTVTPTRFIYVDGWEDGVIIGLINYPRFPKEKQRLIYDSWEIAQQLQEKFGQIRVSITTPEKTYCLGID